MRISDWSSDVCSSDLKIRRLAPHFFNDRDAVIRRAVVDHYDLVCRTDLPENTAQRLPEKAGMVAIRHHTRDRHARSEEHTSELQSLMSTSYAAFCLKKKQV